MRRILITATAAIALLAPASAFAADASVSVTDAFGYLDNGNGTRTSHINVGESVTWTWNNVAPHSVAFADGDGFDSGAHMSPDAPTAHQFMTAGVFHYFDKAGGCTDYASCPAIWQGTVVVDGPPVAIASGPASAQRGQTVSFDGSSSYDPDQDTISYSWDFGDGSAAATGAHPQHSFSTAGHYDVKLTVTDSTASAGTTVGIDITIPDADGDGVNDDADECDDVPASTSNGCPPPVVLPPPLAAFNSSAVAATILGQGGVIKSGVTVVVNCSEQCTAVVTLLRGTSTVGTRTVALAGPGSQLVTVPISAGAKRSLAKAKNPKLTVRVVVTDAHGRVATLSKTIQLKAVKSVGKLPAIGISDQQPRTFSDPFFQILRLRYARLVTPWNSVITEKDRLDGWLREARAHGVRPLVSFEHARGQVCPGKHCNGPTASQYKKAWRAFHKKYPWVKDISPWNEANSATQPTGKKPQTAAAYYNIVRTSCRGCQIVAADLLDTNNLRRYLVAFLAKAKGKPRLWGLHNYRDTNRFRETGTRTLLRYVKGKVWFTETGGIVRFETQDGTVALPKSEKRAKKAMDYMFKLAEKYASRVKRVYVYQWRINFTGDRFDAGVVRDDGSPRPSFQVLTLNASVARKR